jgi:hypothetical protein
MSKDELKLALHKAFDLGSKYGQQADSEYSSQWKKADATRAQLDQLIEDTAKQALAAPVQEPVAQYSDIVSDGGLDPRNKFDIPAAQRTWVGLTRAECLQIEKDMAKYYDYRHECKTVCLPEFARAIEAKLKEKNNG